MRTRHRVPTIFNLSMVDVLCCALGCVILLWLLNFREAKRRAAAAGLTEIALNETRDQLAKVLGQLDQTRTMLDRKADELRTLGGQLVALEKEATTRDALLKQTQNERDQLGRDLDLARTRLTNLTRDRDQLTRDRDQLTQDLDGSKTRLAELARDRDLLTRERDQLSKELDLGKAQVVALNKDKAAMKSAHDLVVDLLNRKAQESDLLARELKSSEKRLGELDATLKAKDTQITAASRTADTLAEGLRQADQRARELRAQAELVPGLQGETKSLRERLLLTEGKVLALEKDLGDTRASLLKLETSKSTLAKDLADRGQLLASAQAQVEMLQGETRRLADVANRVRQAADNRFAGITLTGRRVIFLVDMSGSMDLLDDRTAAPNKWAGVRDTLVKIMRSLPDLEKFQVILFSERASFLLGGSDRWLDYDSQTSTDQVAQAMTATKPEGNTNIYAAFEQAFRFRQAGLDTIYLLSDGLPNIGEGLGTAAASRTLRDSERTELLARHVRRTLVNDWNRPLGEQPRVKIHTVGFFYESPDVGAFLWAMSRENEGSFVGMSKP